MKVGDLLFGDPSFWFSLFLSLILEMLAVPL